MKSKLLLFCLFLLSIHAFAQTPEERREIVKDYDSESIAKLNAQLLEKNRKNDSIVDAFLANNQSYPRFKRGDNGGLMELRYIIEGQPIYISTDNVNSAKATRTNFLNTGGSLGLNLDGQNMHIATWDGGPTLATHQEFKDDSPIPQSRVNNPDLSASNDQSDHSTHVSGTIIAKGVNPAAKGMAPKATLTSFDWDNDDVEALSEATNNGLLLSNHSYGIAVNQGNGNTAPTWLMGCYSSESSIWDNVAYNAPYYLMVASAGNDGQTSYTGGLAPNYDKLTGNKTSKNNLVVANANNPLINPSGNGQLLSLFINTSSSQGPTDDGRIKPDICADGTSVFSSISTNNTAYATYSGTSMAAPNTSGTLLLLQQYYNQLHGNYMRSSTLKGLVCHTADDDFTQVGPDPIFGWGLLNAKAAAETLLMATTNQAVVSERTLAQGESYTYTFSADGSGPISATICWTDPPGTVNDGSVNNPSPALVNDLDLRLQNTSTTFFPWKLQLSNVTGGAVTGDNNVDTVENIDITSPSSGVYTLTVSHKGTLTSGSQQYALILTGSGLTLSNEDFALNTNFKVWPNPVKDQLYYSFKSVSQGDVNIEITDINGRLVYKNTDKSLSSFISGSIDMSSFSKGIYFVKIRQGNFVQTEKIVH
ncbi:MAG: S8 family serine peptidase [Mangrovimonas sp.]|nr:S8 family serine peptidase [Mangrovimonas sp.]